MSHLAAGNVDKRLFLRLALPGAVGGAVGAYVLTQIPGEIIRPLIYLYLLVLAIIILARAAGRWMPQGEIRRVPVLGFFAGLLDASGGGGWGRSRRPPCSPAAARRAPPSEQSTQPSSWSR